MFDFQKRKVSDHNSVSKGAAYVNNPGTPAFFYALGVGLEIAKYVVSKNVNIGYNGPKKSIEFSKPVFSRFQSRSGWNWGKTDMMARIKIFLLEKRRLIVMTILSAYLIALTVKTAHLYYTEVWTNAEPPGQSLDVDGVK